MPRSFNYESPVIAVGALPDADPNVATPPPNRIFNSPVEVERGGGAATAVQYGLVMDVAGTVDVTAWVQDKKSSRWFRTATVTAVANDDLLEVVGVAGADLFFQLTVPVGFATVTIRAESTP